MGWLFASPKAEENSVEINPSTSSLATDASVLTEVYSPRHQRSTRQTFDWKDDLKNSSRMNDVLERGERTMQVDYDKSPTGLYTLIQNHKWDAASEMARRDPSQIRTWVCRYENEDKSQLRWRLLPIHAVCVFGAPDSLVELLLDNFPSGCMEADDQGMLPIHLACRNGASKGVIKMLLETYPESVTMVDKKNRTPIDFVETSKQFNRDSVLMVLQRYEKAAEISLSRSRSSSPTNGKSGLARNSSRKENEVPYESRTTLVKYIEKKEWDKAAERCKEFPEEAETWIATAGLKGDLKFLPIHKVCVRRPPKAVVDALVAAFPEGASRKDQDGWLPLHCACYYGCSADVVKILLEAYPKGSKMKDDDGYIPLHYSCLKSSSLGVIQALLDENPKGAQCKDFDGKLAMHIACAGSAKEDVVRALYKASSKSVQCKDDEGKLPLHYACHKECSADIVKVLLEAFTRGARIQDDHGKLPMHYACESLNGKRVIHLLTQAYPKAVTVTDGFGYTPLMAARALGKTENAETVQILLTSSEEQEGEDKENGSSSNAIKSKSSGATSSSDLTQKDLLERIAALERTVSNFTMATKDMKDSLAGGHDAKNVLGIFVKKLDSKKVGILGANI